MSSRNKRRSARLAPPKRRGKEAAAFALLSAVGFSVWLWSRYHYAFRGYDGGGTDELSLLMFGFGGLTLFVSVSALSGLKAAPPYVVTSIAAAVVFSIAMGFESNRADQLREMGQFTQGRIDHCWESTAGMRRGSRTYCRASFTTARGRFHTRGHHSVYRDGQVVRVRYVCANPWISEISH
jgi:hypothetical protein